MRPDKPRPIRRPIVKKLNDYRIPNNEPLTPRLRPESKDLDAIGFVHDFGGNDDE